jgi:FkbM family methyltransferase
MLLYQHYFQAEIEKEDAKESKDSKEKRRFFFLEMGAYDGLAESNTRFFETCLGWTGLLIEASPRSFEKLKENALTHRPNSDLLNVAPSCTNFSYVDMPAYSNTGVSMHDNTTMLKDMRPVQCGPLSFYLEELGVRKIDLWVLDVEAYEWYVLSTFDFAKVEVEVRGEVCV